jgi:hypothetical protein
MNSYVCPRCHTRGPFLLRANQVCKTCQSAQAWARFGGSNQVLVINPKVEVAAESRLLSDSPPIGGSRITWALFILSLALTASALALVVYFFKKPPPTISAEQLLNRFNVLATSAGILGGLALLTSIGIFHYARRKGYNRRASIRIVGPIVIFLAAGVFAAAFSCWSRTEKVRVLSSVQPSSTDPLIQRLHTTTTVIQALDKRLDRYRSAKGAGVIIGTKSGKTWILTVPYSNDSWRDLPGSDALWVNFSDGRAFPGRVRWVAQPAINLAIVEVEADAPAGEVQLHPIAEGVIPAEQVLVVPNPIRAEWTLEPATILNRRGTRTNSGWTCLVDIDLSLQNEDVGSGMYDRDGRLLGLKTGFDQRRGTSQFVIVSSDLVSGIRAVKESANFEVLDALSLEGRKP